jgi:hypothetical protein
MKCKRDPDGRKLDHTTRQAMRMQEVKVVGPWRGREARGGCLGMNRRTTFSRLARLPRGAEGAASQTHPRAASEGRGREDNLAGCAASETRGAGLERWSE